jgi:hypothetical protein
MQSSAIARPDAADVKWTFPEEARHLFSPDLVQKYEAMQTELVAAKDGEWSFDDAWDSDEGDAAAETRVADVTKFYEAVSVHELDAGTLESRSWACAVRGRSQCRLELLPLSTHRHIQSFFFQDLKVPRWLHVVLFGLDGCCPPDHTTSAHRAQALSSALGAVDVDPVRIEWSSVVCALGIPILVVSSPDALWHDLADTGHELYEVGGTSMTTVAISGLCKVLSEHVPIIVMRCVGTTRLGVCCAQRVRPRDTGRRPMPYRERRHDLLRAIWRHVGSEVSFPPSIDVPQPDGETVLLTLAYRV